MSFVKLSFVVFITYSVAIQISVSFAYRYPLNPSLTLAQAEALQDAAAINQAATLNQAAINQAILNEAVPLNNPLYNYKEILCYPPYSLYCDCDCSAYLDPIVANELIRIADQYNQRLCDLQQWYIISETVMPTLPDTLRLNMIENLAKAVYDEQARRQLAYLPEYPAFCNSIYPDALPILSKRSPDVEVTSTTPPAVPSTSSLAYYYNLMYLLNKTLPSLSPKLQQDIKEAVYSNIEIPQLGQAPELIRRLNNNIRVTISEMCDFTLTF